jgi:two-component system NtrC family sensor kinase
VLHNVGNVLNSVNVSASLVEEAIRKSKIARIGQIAQMLDEHGADLPRFLTVDEKGKLIAPYIKQLAQHLATEQEQLLGEMRSLGKHVGHIKDIIGVQQSVAKVAGVVETASPRELLEDALRMVAASLERRRVTVEREFAETPSVDTDKHKVLQILVNLLTNAMDAVRDGGGGRPGVLRLRIVPNPGGAGACIEVTDNGVGIAPENLTKIFTHGFTTKKDGHGFGLHSAALAAKELQGSLTAHSEGPGSGATFVLSLPHKLIEQGAAA